LDFCIIFSRYAKRKLLLHRQDFSFFSFQNETLVTQFIDLDLLLDFRIRFALLQILILFFQLVPLFRGKLFQGLFFLFQLAGSLFQAFLDGFQALLKFLQVRFLFFLFFFLYRQCRADPFQLLFTAADLVVEFLIFTLPFFIDSVHSFQKPCIKRITFLLNFLFHLSCFFHSKSLSLSKFLHCRQIKGKKIRQVYRRRSAPAAHFSYLLVLYLVLTHLPTFPSAAFFLFP